MYMQNWIIELIEQFGYLSIFFLITLENLFPPIPSEIILSFGGFMTTYTKLTIPGVVLWATAGSVTGAVILYGIGSIFDEKRMEKIIGSWGHVLRIEVKDIHKAGSWFRRYGYWTVFFCRMIPVIRSLISIPAGMARMKFGLFLFFTTLGTVIWNILLVGAGAFLGQSWPLILRYLQVYSHITYILLGLIVFIFIAYHFLKKR